MPSRKIKKASHHLHVDQDLFKKAGRAAPGSVERLQYFEALVNELCVTKHIDYKQQVK